MSLMGVDLGTTGVKAVIFNEEGRILGSGYREYRLIYPGPSGWVELDPEEMWAATVLAIRQASLQAGSSDPVQALAVSSMGETFVPIGKDGQALRNAIANLDTRASLQARFIEDRFGGLTVFQKTGHPIHPMYTLPKILWLKENQPQIVARTWKFLCGEDFLLYRLGASEAVTDWTLASRTMGFDVVGKNWWSELRGALGIDEALLPQPLPSGRPVGTLTDDLAEELDLPKGVLLATGGHDQPCGCLGSGVVKGGVAMDAIGTVDCITVALSQPVLSETMWNNNFCCYPHTVEDLYVTVTWSWTGGILLRWYRDTFATEEKSVAIRTGTDVYDLILAQVSQEPTNIFVLPHFTPTTGTPYMDTRSSGVIAGLNLNTDRGQIIRALLEGINYEMRLNLERLREAGIVVSEIRAIGGGARSPFWLQLKADMFSLPVVRLSVTEAAAFGAALLAGQAAGKWSSAGQRALETVVRERVFEPRADVARLYDERFALYADLYPTLRDWLHRRSALS
ncbi:MAG: FGGY family carbohydrate kinase [Armatimonadetes bacterium]|nr:FGGY family carbohydrate kinase [Armatimonadota bacterium]MDW8121354.1 FGGY-family carbohydrate kinase [Armatimonadota bacterium]